MIVSSAKTFGDEQVLTAAKRGKAAGQFGDLNPTSNESFINTAEHGRNVQQLFHINRWMLIGLAEPQGLTDSLNLLDNLIVVGNCGFGSFLRTFRCASMVG